MFLFFLLLPRESKFNSQFWTGQEIDNITDGGNNSGFPTRTTCAFRACLDVFFTIRMYRPPCQDQFLPVRICYYVLFNVRMYSSLSGCYVPFQGVEFPVRMCSSPSECIPLHPVRINSSLTRSFSMYSSLLGCIIPCQDVLFPLWVYHSLS